MATNRYWAIRRDIYTHCSDIQLRKNRSFHEMKQLFKRSYWGMLIGMILCLSSLLSPLFAPPQFSWISIIGLVGILLLSGASEFLGDKVYHPAARQREVDEQANSLDRYLSTVQQILSSHGIDNKELRECLRQECLQRLSHYNKKTTVFNSRIADILIGIFLGFSISSIVTKLENSDATLACIIAFLIIGLAVMVIARIIKRIIYYSEGGFKDQLLLDVLNELNYLP